MADESVYDNPIDLAEERFAQLEVQVTYINCNVKLLMATLTSKLRMIGEDKGPNLVFILEEKFGYQEEPQNKSQKPKKEKLILSATKHSQSFFKMEEKVYIKSCQGEIDYLKLIQYFHQSEVYFSVHHIDQEHKKSFSCLKLEGHALTQWERHICQREIVQ